MIKRFCDICGNEITRGNSIVSETPGGRLGAKIKKNGAELKVEMLTSVDGTANKGDVCKYCVLDALYKLDDRPQAV